MWPYLDETTTSERIQFCISIVLFEDDSENPDLSRNCRFTREIGPQQGLEGDFPVLLHSQHFMGGYVVERIVRGLPLRVTSLHKNYDNRVVTSEDVPSLMRPSNESHNVAEI